MRRLSLLAALALSACAPDQVGEDVGRSLYGASVNTGRAIATLGDRTGAALERAGSHLRTGSNAAPYAEPPQLPPPYLPDGYGGAVTAEPLGPARGGPGYDLYRDGPLDTPPNPALGY